MKKKTSQLSKKKQPHNSAELNKTPHTSLELHKSTYLIKNSKKQPHTSLECNQSTKLSKTTKWLPTTVEFNKTTTHLKIMGKVWQIIPCLCFFSLKWRSAFMLQFHAFKSRISPQWLSELRWLWACFPWQIACKPVFLLGSYTMPGQYSQPTLTSLVRMYACLSVTCHLYFW